MIVAVQAACDAARVAWQIRPEPEEVMPFTCALPNKRRSDLIELASADRYGHLTIGLRYLSNLEDPAARQDSICSAHDSRAVDDEHVQCSLSSQCAQPDDPRIREASTVATGAVRR